MSNDPSSRPNVRRAAIIGSGLSGLTAAHRLQAKGVTVTLFEKSRGPGGRLASKRLPDGSVDIGAQYFTIRNPAFRTFLNRYAGPDCYQPWQADLRYQKQSGKWEGFLPDQRYVGVPRMTAISRRLSEGLTLHKQVRIGQLARASDGHWQLVDTDGQRFGAFDAVIITTPPAQARDLLEASDLEPLVHTFEEDIGRMQACWTLVARFEPGLGLDYQGLQPRSDILQWAGNNSSKPGREDSGEWWVLHGRPDWSDEHRDAEPAFIESELLRVFTQATGVERKPEQTLTHRWLYARSSAKAGPGHLWFDEQRVALIGDWLVGGRVEGAFDSAESLVRDWRSSGLLD
ncbi:MAG: FAD-dependent oxidoreductase [Marinobacter sp.]|uniref:NAD(P)/FAD-dependent oxidoreductase n=1 Tax=Marinobacter sp. TaxID=50741 RepID=UPI00299D38FA|nr:FAD-dependent oxidoreductase [Marinobacter sp.]MDX1634366.1 FAD-dependent oxidoreductase [Marinobacter sp.]